MKKTKCMGTSKNKRAMSGGRGKIGKYTQKFKRSYKRFDEIEDKGDDESRFKKMEEWGRMRNIYNFLKIQNDKYKGSAGTETTAWEKMKDNDEYKSAISCFDEIDNHILSEGECISEEDYMKGDTSGTPTVIAEASNNDTPDADDEAPAPEVSDADAPVTPAPVTPAPEAPVAEAPVAEAPASEVPASEVSGETEAPADVSSDSESSNTGETEATPKVSSASDVSNDAADTAPTVDDTASQATTTDAVNTDNAAGETEANPEVFSASDVSDDAKNDNKADADADEAPAPAPATDAEVQRDDQGGGRSKRRQKSSRRRRGKSMKSKKGRKTRRKHRAGRH